MLEETATLLKSGCSLLDSLSNEIASKKISWEVSYNLIIKSYLQAGIFNDGDFKFIKDFDESNSATLSEFMSKVI